MNTETFDVEELLVILEHKGLWAIFTDETLRINYHSPTLKSSLDLKKDLNNLPLFETELGQLLSINKAEIQKNPNFSWEEIIHHKNLSYYKFEICPRLKDQQPSGFFILISNIDKEKLNEEFLQDSQKDAKIGSWYLDLKSGKAKWSNEVYAIYEIPEDTPTDFALGKASYPKEEQERLDEKIAKAIEGVSFVDIFKFISSNDILKFVRVTARPVYQEDIVVALKGSIQDVTDLYLKEYTTREALADSKTAIIEWHPNKEIMQVDSNWHTIFKCDKQTPKVNWLRWLESIHPEDREEWEKTSNSALKELPNFDINLRIVTPKGDIKNIQCHFKIFRNQQGDPARIIGTASDVTKIKRTEAELKEQYRMMAQTSKMAQLGEITAGLGHEINNPLTIALGNHRLIKNNIKNEINDPKKLQTINKSLDDQYESLQRIRKLVKNFKNFSHSKNQGFKVFDISQSILETCELFKVLINRYNIHLVMDVEKGLTTKGNKERFNQVITNLLSNAIDALESTEKKYLSIKCYAEENSIVLTVKDNGPGIPDEIKEKIFDQFFTTKEVGKGTGIGLALCRSIIEQTGGELTLSEDHLEGALFVIRLPLVTRDSLKDGPQELLSSFQKEHLSKLKGALVDDEEGVSLLLKSEISELGPSLTIFNSPIKLLEYLDKSSEKKPFDFIITDNDMPKMTGLELLQELSVNYDYTRNQLFVLSAGMPNFLERKLNKVAKSIFSKPLDLVQVALSLAEVSRNTSLSLSPEDLHRDILNFCQYIGPKIKSSFTVVEFSGDEQRTLYTNPAFTLETLYEGPEVIGKNLNLLQGERSEKDAIDYMRNNFKRKESFVVDLVNYKKDGTPFLNRLVLLPLIFKDSTFYFGLQTNLDNYTEKGQSILHERIKVTINLPINKVIQELLTCFYNGQLKGELFNDMASQILEEIENIRHYILKL